jgi:predicted RNA-binding Zn ribbon-like protein
MSRGSKSMRRAWVLPEEPVAVRLMNTIWADRAGVHDDLLNPADLVAWLVAVGLDARIAKVSDADVLQAHRLRDALRRIAALCTDDERVAAASPLDVDTALEEINDALAHQPWARLTVRAGRLERETASAGVPLASVLAAVSAEAVDLFTGPDRSPLRACDAPGCVLYFVRSHPRREWCSIACGNRARAARHYQRVRASGSN